MKLAIVGSRSFFDYQLLVETLQDLDISEIVSGGARGADTLAEKYAKEKGIPVKIFKPDWDGLGKAAGFIRNKSIIDYADKVIAFWDGQSHGTQHSMNLALKQDKLMLVKNFTLL